MHDVKGFLSKFESCEWPFEDWHHREHLIVAWHYLRTEPHQALDRVRAGIKRYNAAHGIVDSPTRGYHETLTRFFVKLVERNLDHTLSETEQLHRILENCTFEHVLQSYSRERLNSPEARQGWCEPDLAP